MRLIDADALYQQAMDIVHDKKDMKLLGIVNAIDTAPTIDAEPIRHAVWTRPTNSPLARYCSLCNTRHIVGMPNNYCTNCGAKMEGGKQHESIGSL